MKPAPTTPYFDLTTLTTREALAAHYRTLARTHHPDLGGDESVMQDINAQYQAALQALYQSHLPVIIPPEKPTKPTKAPKTKAPKAKAPQKKRAPVKQKASPKRGRTVVDFWADVTIMGVEFVRDKLRER
jgi:hypothetical protein